MTATERVLFVDASAGASGDMVLGALVDLGAPLDRIRRAVSSLEGVRLRQSRVDRSGLAARKVSVSIPENDDERDWRDIRRLVNGIEAEPAIRERALRIFRRLFEAEGRAHGRSADRVHLHEAGALDAIVDIVGACVGLAHLRAARIVVSPLTTGSGTVRCRHGIYPVPGPATTFLLEGAPLSGIEADGERLTPTGAAILTTVADAWGGLPRGRILATGHGAGDHDYPDRPNVLRMILCDAPRGASLDTSKDRTDVIVVEFTVDDDTPQRLAYTSERLLAAGALDVFTTPVHMKKGRTGHNVTVIARRQAERTLVEIVLEETSTLGVRIRSEERIELDRGVRRVRTPYGVVGVKVVSGAGVLPRAYPEYDDCVLLARRHRAPLRDVQQAALDAYRKGEGAKSRGRKARR